MKKQEQQEGDDKQILPCKAPHSIGGHRLSNCLPHTVRESAAPEHRTFTTEQIVDGWCSTGEAMRKLFVQFSQNTSSQGR
jgi:hypothetical protein